MLDVLYLVPNLGDAAAEKRVLMLEAGGASVTRAGFRRRGAAAPRGNVLSFGSTADGKFAQRMMAVAHAAVSIRARLGGLPQPDVIVARNLEMLFLAVLAQGAWAVRPAIVYECLDIHRLMLRRDALGAAMRALERWLLGSVGLLITSSPAFVREYFDCFIRADVPTLVIENKVLDLSDQRRGSNPAFSRPDDETIRIGWFGALRCAQSLAALMDLAANSDGAVDVVLRGRPALRELPDFERIAATAAHLRYGGPYSADALATIYSDAHLVWAIDLFEEGQNSAWLLPNRIYEGCFHGAIPVALAGTETAALLKSRGIGIILPDIQPETLREMITSLDRQTLRRLAEDVRELPTALLEHSRPDCHALVARLAALPRGVPVPQEEVA